MSDRSRTPIMVAVARIGRTDLGEATIVIDDDALSISVREAPAERPLRIDLATIDAVSISGDELTLPLRSGTRLTFVCDTADETRAAILGVCRSLPELTSALRTFGSRRGNRSVRPTAADEQRRFFAPMLRARREAGEASTPQATIAAFDISALLESTHRALKGFAEQRFGEAGPGRRALEAELLDSAELLDDSYARLRAAAEDAASAVDELPQWRSWSAALRSTFETADRAWLSIDAILEAAPIPVAKQNSKNAQKQTPKKP
jgi:hypothetical protein